MYRNGEYTGFADYRLPDGRVVQVDDSAAKGALFLDYELESHGGPRRFVQARRVVWFCADCGRPTGDNHECAEQRRANRAAQRRVRP